MKRILSYFILLSVALAMVTACSTKKNTAPTRFWHGFTAKYNTYFNGSEAYKEGFRTKERNNQDNYTELIPIFYVGNESSRGLGAPNFLTAVKKCEKAIQLHSIKRRPVVSGGKKLSPKEKAYLSRKEFNPFLKNAWLLMGKAQFQKGEFLEAASTFSYMTRLYAAEPIVAAEARVWLARCYSQLEWYYDAEEALSRARKDSLTRRVAKEHQQSMADLLMHRKQYAEAIPILEKIAKNEKRKMQKARLYFLLGQVHQMNGNKEAAYKSYKKCIAKSPPYELAFNARIHQTEVMAEGSQVKKMVKRLRSMARSSKNKEYLDQVYYAMGNIYLTQNDTARAITAYEDGRAKSTRGGIEKGVLLLKLAEIYWERGRYDLAQGCYTDALGIISKDYEGYDEITRRSKVLDELVPHTSAIYLQDSLLALSVMSEADRNAAIDRVITILKEKEKKEKEARADSLAEARQQEGGNFSSNNRGNASNQNQNQNQDEGKEWYFYNSVRVSKGKQDFRKHWGTRKNEDNWRRSNRTVLQHVDNESIDYEKEDSIANAKAKMDSLQETESDTTSTDSVAADPHTREYYLAQIPFSDEAKEESHKIIREALYEAGLLEKDALEDFPLAAKTLTRLYTDYPKFEKLEDVYYQLFLLYSRWGNKDMANVFKKKLAEQFGDGAYSRMINDPDFERNAKFGRLLEDSLYTATYQAYRDRKREEVNANFYQSTQKYPKGANRPKFIFVHALNQIGSADKKAIIEELRNLVKEFPESDVSELAGMLVKGLESGREVGDPHYQLGSLWERRAEEAEKLSSEAGKEQSLSPERNAPFVCLIAYPTDSLNDDQLLYDIAHFNFTGFMVRNFDLSVSREKDITSLRVKGFNNFDEAHNYAQKLFGDEYLAKVLKHTRVVLISEDNLELLGGRYSYNDYQKFYEQTFAPLQINPDLPLDTEGGPIEQHYEDEYSDEELEEMQNEDGESSSDDDEGEWY